MIIIVLDKKNGFSLLEILFVIAIIVFLGAISLPVYQGYQERARATEIILIFDSLRADLEQGPYQSCNELRDRVNGVMKTSETFVMLSVGFQTNKVSGV